MKKTFKIAALVLLASFAFALAGCSNSSGGGAPLAAFGAGGGNGTGGDNNGGGSGTGGDNTGSGQSQQNTTETKWTISGTEYTVKDGKVTVTQNGTKTEVGTVDSSGVVTITQGGQTITVQAQGAGTSNVTVTIATTTTDANGASTTTTKTYSGDLTGGTLVNTEDANDTITIAKVETTTGGGNGGNAATYTITIAQGIEHGTVSADKTSAAQGDTVTLTATPQDGYQLGAWSVTDSDGAAVTVEGGAFVMPAKNVTVSATFTQLAANTYSISVHNGTAKNADGKVITSASEGSIITIIANVPAGKVFYKWLCGDEIAFDRTASPVTFVMPAFDVGMNASTKWIDYTVTYADGVDSAVIAVPTDSTAYRKGDTVTVKFDGVGTRDGYTFAGWTDGTTTYTSAGTKTFTMGTANVTLTALWDTAITQYTFHDTPEVLPAGTDGSNGTGSTYVYFGDYPQDVLSKKLEAKLIFDESRAITRGSLTYIPASDGNYYVRICAQTPYSGSYCPKYVDGTYTENNSWRYFKVMPIKWRVLTDSYDVDGTSGSKKGQLLVAESILDANVPFYVDTIWRDRNKDQPSNYESSQIRAFLNGLSFYNGFDTSYKSILNTNYSSKGFLQTAFGTSAISKIITTHVDNSAAQKLGTSEGNQGQDNGGICNDTDDKIFLLSSREWTNSAYSFGDFSARVTTVSERNNRQRYPTDFAYARYAGFRPSYPGDHYTRTPTYRYNGGQINYCFVDKVLYDGRVYTVADINNPDTDTSTSGRDTGIVPALCIPVR